MQSSREQHGDEHRMLSPHPQSSTTDERLCEPIAQPPGGALVRAAPVPGRQAEQPSRASAPPATGVPSRPLSSADLRVVQLPPGPDHPGGMLYEVASRWSDIAPDNAKDVAGVAADSVVNPLADASSSGAERRTAAAPAVVGASSGAVRRVAASPAVVGVAAGAERLFSTLPSTRDASSAASSSRS